MKRIMIGGLAAALLLSTAAAAGARASAPAPEYAPYLTSRQSEVMRNVPRRVTFACYAYSGTGHMYEESYPNFRIARKLARSACSTNAAPNGLCFVDRCKITF